MNQMEEAFASDNQSVLHLRKTMDMVKENFLLCWPLCNNDDQRKEVATRSKDSMLRLIRSELVLDSSRLVEEVPFPTDDEKDPNGLQNATERYQQDCADKFQEYLEELTPKKLKKHPEYVLLMDMIKNAYSELQGGNDTQDLSNNSLSDVNSEAIPTMDPITKQPLTDPIRNKKCLHIYGKTSMMALMKKNTKIRCPQIGCANRDYISVNDLIEDPALKAKVYQQTVKSQRYAVTLSQKKKADTTTELDNTK